MATLQIENIPEELYTRLQELADAQNCSINAFAIAILEAELSTKTKPLSGQRKKSVRELLAEISRRREYRPANMGMILDSTALIREEREGIEKTPGTVGGNARIAETRISVWGLVESRRLGATDAQLLEDYPHLSGSDLKNAWAYAEAFPDEIEAAIKLNDLD